MQYKRVLGCILTKHEGKFIIIKNSRFFTINESGARFYELCNGNRSMSEIVDILSRFYDMDPQSLLIDLEKYAKTMLELGVLKLK